MQRSALIVTLFSLFALFSVALASPLPVQAIQEAREAPVEFSVRDGPVDHVILQREVIADPHLQILAREHKTFEEYVQEMTGGSNSQGGSQPDSQEDSQDMEPRFCRGRNCF